LTLIDEAVAALRRLNAGMLLTHVRHAFVREQNKFKGHVLRWHSIVTFTVQQDNLLVW